MLVWLLLPSAAGGEPLRAEMQRVVIRAASDAECLRYAEQLAEAQRRLHADLLRKNKGSATGECRRLGSLP